ncbi:MAG: MATE family efflux transporter [Deltaproteobacteria bacterium]|nr:MATE family efflux transporter [Deltaproteobacteria bacterium]
MSSSAPSQGKLTEGPVREHLVRLVVPMMVGMVSVITFNLVDTYFVGLLGTTELAAMSFTFPVVFSFGSFTIGLGVGVMSLVSRAIGSAQTEQVRRLTTDALLLALVLVAAFSVVGYLTIDPVFRLLGATDAVLPHIRDYMEVWYLGMVFLVVPMVGNSVIRATGDTKTPAKVMVFAGLINAVLDPLFIFGLGPLPAFGLKGAAIATVIGRACTLVVALWILVGREHLLDLRPVHPARVLRSWGAALAMGLPIAGSNIAVPLTTGFVTRLVAEHGEEAVAAFGAASRIEGLALLPLFSLGAGLAPFVGQNWGAGQIDRIDESIALSRRFSFWWGLIAWGGLSVLAVPLAWLFPDTPGFFREFTHYLWIAPIGYGLFGMVQVAVSSFNAMGRQLVASALTLFRAPLLVAAGTLLGGWALGIDGVFAGLGVANVAAGATAIWAMRRACAARRASLAAAGA